jgi:hypothetical protein
MEIMHFAQVLILSRLIANDVVNLFTQFTHRVGILQKVIYCEGQGSW